MIYIIWVLIYMEMYGQTRYYKGAIDRIKVETLIAEKNQEKDQWFHFG